MDIKNLNAEELYKFVLPTLININEKYLFLMLDSNKLKENFFDYIVSKTNDYDGKIDYIEYIKEEIDNKYQELTIEKVQENPLKLIDYYLKFYYIETNKINKIIDFLRKFDDFLEVISIYDNEDLIFEVVKNNKIINELLRIIVDNILNNKRYRYLKNNPKLETLIAIYANLNNIDLDSYNEEKIEGNRPNYEVDNFFHDGYLDMDKFYSAEIRYKDLLTYSEEIELGRRIKKGDKEALNKLIESNLRWAYELSKRYTNKGLDENDIVQEANIGLYKAALKYDPDKGYRFSTYATWWIKQTIRRAIVNDGKIIRIPVHLNDELEKYRVLKYQLWDKIDHEPTSYDMIQEYGMRREYVETLEKLNLEPISLDRELGEDEDTKAIEMLEDKTIKDFSNIDVFEEILKDANLTEKEKNILRRRYKNLETGAEVGNYYHISRQRVEQIEKNAFKKILSNPKKRETLAIYLQEFGIRKNGHLRLSDNQTIYTLSKEIATIISLNYNRQSGIYPLLKKIGFTKQNILYLSLKYALKMETKLIYRHNCMSKQSCYLHEKKISEKMNNQEFRDYINDKDKLIKGLKLEDVDKKYQKILTEVFDKSDFVDKIKIQVSYYLEFIDESRFIYILKNSNFEIREIIYFILKYIFGFDDNNIKIVGYRIKGLSSVDKNCLIKMQNSSYKEELKYYLNNKELVLEELGIEFKDKQLLKRP